MITVLGGPAGQLAGSIVNVMLERSSRAGVQNAPNERHMPRIMRKQKNLSIANSSRSAQCIGVASCGALGHVPLELAHAHQFGNMYTVTFPCFRPTVFALSLPVAVAGCR